MPVLDSAYAHLKKIAFRIFICYFRLHFVLTKVLIPRKNANPQKIRK